MDEDGRTLTLPPPGRFTAASAALASTLEAERARWFLWLPVLLGVGIAFYFWLQAEPGWAAVAGFGLGALSLRLLARHGLTANLVTAALIAVASGVVLAKLRTDWVRAPVLERTLYRAEVQGFVELVEPRPERGERITLKVVSIAGIEAAKLPTHARIRTMVTTPGLKPGDLIRLKARISPPAPPSLPGDYDFARAAYFQRLGATGFALAAAEIVPQALSPVREATFADRWSQFLEGLRQTIGSRVAAALPGERGAIATALITGARGGITETTNAAFRDAGLFHILSISGLHMVVMAGAAFFGVRRLLALFPAIALNYPVKKWAAAIALCAAIAYLNISGSSVATVRSAVMIAIIFLAVLIDRPALAMRNVALSALLILAVMPESLLDAGFQMSFAAVISLIAVYEVLRARAERDGRLPVSALRQTGLFFGGIVMSTLIASISVAPLAAYHFHRTQQYAILANLIAIPVCNILVMPAGLITLIAMPVGLEALPLAAMGLGIDVMMQVARFVAALPGAVGHIPAISHLSLVLMVLGGLWLTLWETRWRLFGLAIAALGVAAAPWTSAGDILAGRGGALAAVRGPDGRLAAVPGRTAGYELKRWLDNDGDARTPAEAALSEVWRCDPAGCVTSVKGVAVAAVRHPSALIEDCARARILILPFARPAGCAGPDIVLDPRAFWSSGTHVISIEVPGEEAPKLGGTDAAAQANDAAAGAAKNSASATGLPDNAAHDAAGADAAAALRPQPAARLNAPRLRVTTVASQRGVRPWTAALSARPPRTATAARSPAKATAASGTNGGDPSAGDPFDEDDF